MPSFAASQPRPIITPTPLPVPIPNTSTTDAITNPSVSSPHTDLSPPTDTSSSHATRSDRPSRADISNRFIARELAKIREDLTNLKSDFHTAKNCNPSLPPDQNVNIMAIREELKLLHHKIDYLNPCKRRVPPTRTDHPTVHSHSHITISSWNCRGISNSIPYLFHLFKNGTDIIALSEHWLWPYNIQNLSSLHPEYDGFGVYDNRLDENCSLTRGCGGVGFLWKKSLNVIPRTNITSDRFCVTQLQLQNSTYLTLIAVYLPCCNYSDNTYTSYFEDLQSVISSYEPDGPVIICGDFNVDFLNHSQCSRSRLLNELVDNHSLYIVSQSSQFSGPNYTFF